MLEHAADNTAQLLVPPSGPEALADFARQLLRDEDDLVQNMGTEEERSAAFRKFIDSYLGPSRLDDIRKDVLVADALL